MHDDLDQRLHMQPLHHQPSQWWVTVAHVLPAKHLKRMHIAAAWWISERTGSGRLHIEIMGRRFLLCNMGVSIYST